MAYKNKEIVNPQSGQMIRFLQTSADTDGQLLEMESHFQPLSKEPIPHYHPRQEELFRVEEGELTVRLKNRIKVLKKGGVLHIPKNTVHSMWNASDKPAVVNWKVLPALETEYFLENGMGLAHDGKVNEKGVPPLLQAALLINRFSGVYRLSRPAFLLQRILFTLLTPFAWLKGYRGSYAKYVN